MLVLLAGLKCIAGARLSGKSVGYVRRFGAGTRFSQSIVKSSKLDDLQGSILRNGGVVGGVPDDDVVTKLKSISDTSMQGLVEKLTTKSVESPFSVLNELDQKNIDFLMKRFKQKVYHELETKKNDIVDINSINLVDYINPKLNNVSTMIHSINNGNIPVNFPQFYNLSTTNELLTFILTKLFYKEYLQYKVETVKSKDTTLDFSNPAEWFPEARKMKRKIIMHVGPTNSGKTYNSLQKLAKAKSGYYAGPLRLLAREIYERFNKEGIRCNLITGEEVIPSIDEFGKISEISSGTIEMIPLSKKYDICIIDEIQMISDTNRGNAWSYALLGVQAKEVHLCGEASAISIVEKICAITGDELEIKHFKRLGKLTVQKNHLKSIKALKKGDCVITFSKKKIIQLKCKIEQETKFKVAVIYGALPPEIRSEQANGFNDGEYDILVASDAIGMGLNLSINRVVFETVMKFDGKSNNLLTSSQVKQIGGRAGRYNKEHGESEGFVTTLRSKDLVHVTKMMKQPIIDVEKAVIWPTNLVWKHYITKFDSNVSFYQVLLQFAKDVTQSNLSFYEMNELDARASILKVFMKDNLYRRTTIEDQLSLSLAPVNLDMSLVIEETAFKLFKNVTDCTSKNIFDFDFIKPEIVSSSPILTATADQTINNLQELEDMHKIVLLFLWLSQRWPTLFIDKESAFDMKTLIEKRITQELTNLRRINKLK